MPYHTTPRFNHHTYPSSQRHVAALSGHFQHTLATAPSAAMHDAMLLDLRLAVLTLRDSSHGRCM